MSGDPKYPGFPWGMDVDTVKLRDEFAAMAMQGILAGDHPITHELDASRVVTKVAYEFADAMLKARQS